MPNSSTPAKKSHYKGKSTLILEVENRLPTLGCSESCPESLEMGVYFLLSENTEGWDSGEWGASVDGDDFPGSTLPYILGLLSTLI